MGLLFLFLFGGSKSLNCTHGRRFRPNSVMRCHISSIIGKPPYYLAVEEAVGYCSSMDIRPIHEINRTEKSDIGMCPSSFFALLCFKENSKMTVD
jgi:hypothetical protein